MNIGFIGVGNMAGALLNNIKSTASYVDIFIRNSSDESTLKKSEILGVTGAENAREVAEKCNIIFLGVKPNTVEEVLKDISPILTSKHCIISMAAGITLSKLKSYADNRCDIIRIMPNLPALVGEGVISVSGYEDVSSEVYSEIKKLLGFSGVLCPVEEEQIHGVIGVSGSSPAYTYMYIKGLIMAAESEGIDPLTARKMAAQAVLGAAKLALESEDSLDVMVDRVCSKGGTTIEAVEKLRELNFEEIVARGAQEAIYKSKKMSE